MAIQDLLKSFGQRLDRGLTQVGGYDPMQQVSPEEAARRRLEGLSALQRGLGRADAILSGDPRRIQLAEQQIQQAEQDKLLANLAKDPRYAEQIKLLRAGLDPRLASPQTGSVERFTLYDKNSGKPVRTILKSEAENIDRNKFIIGPLADPFANGKENKSERKYLKAEDGFYRYIDDGTKVFGDVKIPIQGFKITTADVLGAQKDERKTFEATAKGVKNFQQLLDAAQATDGAASYALMIKFIKQLDDSVVREGEVNTFGGFQGALTNLKNQISKTTGEGFTPEVKANMINLAAETANRLVNDYVIYKAGKEKSYGAMGFDPNMIFAGLDFNLGGLDLTKEYTPNDFEFIEFEQ